MHRPDCLCYIDTVASACPPQDKQRIQGEGSIRTVRLIFAFFLVALVLPAVAAAQEQPPESRLPANAKKQPTRRGPMQTVVSPVTVEQSPQLFAALCAAHVGGYEAGVPEEQMTQLEAAVRREILKTHGPAEDALKDFYQKHELADPAATLSRYVSFGLVAGDPPKFDFTMTTEDLPPDVLALEGFAPLLTAYYSAAGIDKLYERAKPLYEARAAEAQRTLGQLTLLETAYIRRILEPSATHTFTVYIEPLVGVRSNFRIYGGRYALVLDPSSASSSDEMRHSLLHFLLDRLALAYHPPTAGRKALLDAAARAPRLPQQFRDDIEALTDESLVRAVELRIQRLPAAKAQAQLDEEEADGFVLIRPIYDALDAYEKGEANLASYYPGIIQKLDLNAQAKRVANIRFAPAEAQASPSGQVAETQAAPPAPPSELDVWLNDGERQLSEKDTKSARATFERVLDKYPGVPRAQFGLAVTLIVDGEVSRGQGLLQQVVTELSNPAAGQSAGLGAGEAPTANGPDPRTLAWAHVWLGRIHGEQGHLDLAGVEYRAALAVQGAPQPARTAAERGLAATGSKSPSP